MAVFFSFSHKIFFIGIDFEIIDKVVVDFTNSRKIRYGTKSILNVTFLFTFS